MTAAFRDREEAGERLASLFEKYKGSGAAVLAIPAGGVPVAAAIARSLGLRMQVSPASKVLLPWTTESGYGAVAFDGTVWIDEAAVESYGLRSEQVEKAAADARTKVARRCARFCREPPDVGGQTVILVDDGIAAGSTMRTAIAALRKFGAARIVVAVPTAHDRSLAVLRPLVDDIVCANVRGGPSFAVADAYEEWHDVSDDEAEALLQR